MTMTASGNEGDSSAETGAGSRRDQRDSKSYVDHARSPDRGGVVWITGPPATGKTTLANGLREAFADSGLCTIHLDSDDLRPVLTPSPCYSAAERDHFYGAIAHLAKLAVSGGAFAIISATANRRRYRDQLRREVDRFAEIWLRCDRALREARDRKGLYAAANAGRLTGLPGLDVPYEEPAAAEIVIDTDHRDPRSICGATLAGLAAIGWPLA